MSGGYLPTFTNPGAGSGSERFGLGSLAGGTSAVAIGPSTNASGNFSIAIGNGISSSATEAIAIGSTVGFSNSVGIGTSQTHRGTGGVLIGRSASGYAASNTAYVGIGFAASASTQGVAVGNSALARAVDSIAIGGGAEVASTETSAVIIGRSASTNAGATGGQQVAIGASSSAAWRGTAVGWKATTTVVSGTAIGWAAYSTASHGVAVGRGAWMPDANNVAIGFIGGNGTVRIYPGSMHTHKFVNWWDGATTTLDPTACKVVYSGVDAYDATGSPTSNVAGGPTQVSGGRSTGDQLGGDVLFTTTPIGVSSNTKNTEVVCGKFDAAGSGEESRFWLYDVSDSTLKRVTFGADDSGGSGHKLLRVTN